jgi:phosphatidylinositol alpha-1,6-mannosyltransferase
VLSTNSKGQVTAEKRRLPLRIHVWSPGMCSPGGTQSYSSSIVDALLQAAPDAKLTVFSRNEPSSALRRRLPEQTKIVGTSSAPGRLRAAIFATHVFRHALADRPDLIWCTHLNFAPVAHVLNRFRRTPYWVSLHGIEAWELTNRLRIAALRRADLLLPVSRYTRDRVTAEQGIASSEFEILSDTFDAERFTPGPKSPKLLQRYGLTDKNRVILTVGRLSKSERYKGHDRILRALAHVKARISDVRYLVVGDGADRPRLEQLTRELKLSDSVVFSGRVRADEMVDHYRLCDVFAMPSTGEGFGIVFLEALGCGKPVIAGDRDASAEALKDGELGILIDPDNIELLASSLIEVLTGRSSHPLIYRPDELSRRVVETFGPKAFHSRLEQILREKQLAPSLPTSESFL